MKPPARTHLRDETAHLAARAAHEHALHARRDVRRDSRGIVDRGEQVGEAGVVVDVHGERGPLDGEAAARGGLGSERFYEDRESDLRLRLGERHVERVEHGADEGLLGVRKTKKSH